MAEEAAGAASSSSAVVLHDSISSPASSIAMLGAEEEAYTDPRCHQRHQLAAAAATPVEANALVAKSASSPTLSRAGATQLSGSSTRGALSGRSKKHPFEMQPPFLAPKRDKKGNAVFDAYRPAHTKEWDEKHHFNYDRRTGDRMAENDKKPEGQRIYLSRPHTKEQLKAHLSANAKYNARLLHELEQPEEKFKTSFVTCDASPSQMPGRHAFGGTMRDRDRQGRPWNDRWQTGIATLNEHMHPLHREYFVQPSLFAAAPSQDYRRYMDQQVGPSQWKPIAMKKPHPAPPLGQPLVGSIHEKWLHQGPEVVHESVEKLSSTKGVIHKPIRFETQLPRHMDRPNFLVSAQGLVIASGVLLRGANPDDNSVMTITIVPEFPMRGKMVDGEEMMEEILDRAETWENYPWDLRVEVGEVRLPSPKSPTAFSKASTPKASTSRSTPSMRATC